MTPTTARDEVQRHQAVSLLQHYLQTVFEVNGRRWDNDNNVEVADIVDCIVAAATKQSVLNGGGRAADVLTPRDWFAGKAIGAVVRARVALVNANIAHDLNQGSIAEECYEIADAMLAERAKPRTA